MKGIVGSDVNDDLMMRMILLERRKKNSCSC